MKKKKIPLSSISPVDTYSKQIKYCLTNFILYHVQQQQQQQLQVDHLIYPICIHINRHSAFLLFISISYSQIYFSI